MFVTVRYGDRKSRIFNANCKNDILLHHIRTCCECLHDEVIDVSDERGMVKNLRNNLNDYGTEYLKGRESLILIRVENYTQEDSQERVKFVPLLSGLLTNREFADALNPIPEEAAPKSPPNMNTNMNAPMRQARRRSSVVDFNLDDVRNGKQKSKANGANSTKKGMPRRATTRSLIKSK